MSVESRSGVGWARANSVCWSTRPGVGSITTVTDSIGAAGGCDSRSSSASVRSVRTSRIGVGSSSRRAWISPRSAGGPSRSRTCSTARRDRGARAASTAARAAESGRTTATRPSRSATRDRAWRRSARRAARERADACLLRARSPATPPRLGRAARKIGRRQCCQFPKRPDPPVFNRRNRRARRTSMVLIDSFRRIRRVPRLNLFEETDRQRCERGRLLAGFDDGDARTREREDRGSGVGRGQRDVCPHASGGRLARELGGNRRRRPQQPIQAADVYGDEIGARELVAGREFLRERRQRHARILSRPRLIHTREHRRTHVRERESPGLRCSGP